MGWRACVTTLLMAVVLGAGCSPQTAPTSMEPPADAMPDVPPAPDPAPQPEPPAPLARYRVTFNATWSTTTHPQDPPDDPHFSGLIGGTHDHTVTFWMAGALATEGIQLMAEAGRKSPLDAEVMAAIGAGSAEFLLSGPNLSDSPDATSMEFDVGSSFPLVTLVTMVAPSPDWFVGVSALPLLVDGAWRDEVVVELFAYDAGTDSGLSFESPDEETVPPGPIHRITGFPFLNNGSVPSMGTFTFTRIQ